MMYRKLISYSPKKVTITKRKASYYEDPDNIGDDFDDENADTRSHTSTDESFNGTAHR